LDCEGAGQTALSERVFGLLATLELRLTAILTA
jgi:hypothetical protein